MVSRRPSGKDEASSRLNAGALKVQSSSSGSSSSRSESEDAGTFAGKMIHAPDVSKSKGRRERVSAVEAMALDMGFRQDSIMCPASAREVGGG